MCIRDRATEARRLCPPRGPLHGGERILSWHARVYVVAPVLTSLNNSWRIGVDMAMLELRIPCTHLH
eukprot:2002768-Alexandrium_andersonii.AAC.1